MLKLRSFWKVLIGLFISVFASSVGGGTVAAKEASEVKKNPSGSNTLQISQLRPEGKEYKYSVSQEGRAITFGNPQEGRAITFGGTQEGRAITFGGTQEGRAITFGGMIDGKKVNIVPKGVKNLILNFEGPADKPQLIINEGSDSGVILIPVKIESDDTSLLEEYEDSLRG